MPNNIDERIVEMQFDNKQFESGVKETIGSLDKLKDSLKFEGASDGLDQLEDAAKRVDLSPIIAAAKESAESFNYLEVIAINVLSRITQSAITAGEKLVKSFTVDPVATGFSKYEEKVGAVQQILNTAENVDMSDVEKALAKLTWYTNETSYNFSEMVKAISNFTTSGIKLDTATEAIIGFANAGAAAGASAQKVDHGLIGIARAISSGKMTLGIWNSYMETAGMKSKQFVEQCIKMGVELGTLKKGMDGIARTAKGTEVTIESFANTLREEWLDDKVTIKALESYAVATNQVYDRVLQTGEETFAVIEEMTKDTSGAVDQFSLNALKMAQETKTWTDLVGYVKSSVAQGWSDTWERIFGNYEDAKNFYSELVEIFYELFVASGDTRNAILDMWNAAGGGEAFRNTLLNIASAINGLVKRTKGMMVQLFPIFSEENQEKLAGIIASITKRVNQFTAELSAAFGGETYGIEDGLEKVESSIEGVNSAATELKLTAEEITALAWDVIRGDYGNGAARVEALGKKFKIVQNEVNKLLGCTFEYKDALDDLKDGDEPINEISEATEETTEKFESLQTVLSNLSSTFNGAAAIVMILANAIGAVVRVSTGIVKPFSALGKGLLGVTGSFGDFLVQLKDYVIQNDIFYNCLKSIADVISTFLQPTLEKFYGFMEKLSNREVLPLQWLDSLNLFEGGFDEIARKAEEFGKVIGEQVGPLKEFFKPIKESAINGLKDLFGLELESSDDIKDLATFSGTAFGSSKEIDDTSVSLFGLSVNIKALGETVGTYLGKIFGFFSTLKKYAVDAVTWITNNVDFGEIWATISSTVAEWLPKITGFLSDTFSTFITYAVKIKDTIKAVVGVIQAYFKSFKLPSIKTMFTKFWASVLPEDDIFGVIAKFFNTFRVYKQFIVDLVSNISEQVPIIGRIIGILKGGINGASLVVDVFYNTLYRVFKVLSPLFGSFGQMLLNFADDLKEVHLDKALKAAGLFAFLAIIWKVVDIASVISTVGGVFKVVSEAFSGFMNSLKLKNFASVVLMLAVSVGILAGSIYAIAQIDEWKLAQAGTIIISLTTILGLITIALGQVAKAQGGLHMLAGAGGLLFVVLSVVGAIYALMKLADVDWTTLKDGLLKMGAVIVVLGITFTLLNLVMNLIGGGADWKQRLAQAAALYIFTLALEKVVKTLLTIKDEDLNSIGKALGTLFVIALILIGLTQGLGKLKFSNGVGLILAVGALMMFVHVLKQFKDENFGDILAGLFKLVPIFLALTWIAELGKSIGSWETAAVFLSLGLLFKLLASALDQIASIDPGMLIAASIVVALAMGAIAALLLAVSKMSFDAFAMAEFGIAMFGLGVVLLAVSVALKILSGIDFGRALLSALALSMVIAAIGFAANLAKGSQGNFGALIGMAAVIFTTALALFVLQFVDWQDLLQGALALGSVILVVGGALALIGMANFMGNNVMQNALAMALVIGIVTGALIALTVFTDTGEALSAALGISAVLVALAVAMKVLSALPITGALMAAANLSAFIGTVAVLMSGIGAIISTFEPNYAAIRTGLDFIVEIFTKIGEMIGGFVGGLFGGFAKELPEFANNLSTFMNNVKGFAEGFTSNTIDWKLVATNTKNFKDAINNLKGLTSAADNASMKILSELLSDVGDAIVVFSKKLNEGKFDKEKVDSAASALDSIMEAARTSLDIDFGFASEQWDEAATSFEKIAGSLVAFSDAVSGDNAIDIDAITGSFKSIQDLITMAKDVGDVEGLAEWEKLLGKTTKTKAGNERSALQMLAYELVTISNITKQTMTGQGGIDFGTLDKVIPLIGDLVDIAAKVPDAGSVAKKFWSGEFSWDSLSSGLGDLATAMVNFSKTSYSIMPSGLAQGLDALSQLCTATESLPKSKPAFWEWITNGDTTISGFATALQELASAIVAFSQNFSTQNGYDSTGLDNGIAFLEKFKEFAVGFNTDTELEDISLGYDFLTFAENIEAAYNLLSKLDDNELSGIKTALTSLLTIFQGDNEEGLYAQMINVGSNIVDKIADGLTMDTEYLNTQAMTIITRIATELQGHHEELSTEGGELTKSVGDGFTSENALVILDGKVNTAMTHLKDTVRSWYEAMVGAGEYLGLGVANGFGSKTVTDRVTAVANQVAASLNAAVERATASVSSNGPQDVGYKYAKSQAEGVASGFADVKNAAVASASAFVSAINGEFDDTTYGTITPVFDLTNATLSANKLNTMFDASRASALDANMSINSQVDQMNDLVTAANKILSGQAAQTDAISGATGRIYDSIQNGSDLYLDDGVFAGRINRRLGML